MQLFISTLITILLTTSLQGETKNRTFSDPSVLDQQIQKIYNKRKLFKNSYSTLEKNRNYTIVKNQKRYHVTRTILVENCILGISQKFFLHGTELKRLRQEGPIHLGRIVDSTKINTIENDWGKGAVFDFHKNYSPLVVYFKYTKSRNKFLKTLNKLIPLCRQKREIVKQQGSALIRENQAKSLEDLSFSHDYGLRQYHEGDKIRLLSTGEEALQERLRLIGLAKKEIRIQVLTFLGDRSGELISDALIKKAKEGVKVKVIIDTYSHLFSLVGEYKNWKKTPKVYDRMYAAGIELYGYHPPSLTSWPMEELKLYWHLKGDVRVFRHRIHDKYFIIDNDYLIVGGTNIGDVYFDMNPPGMSHWRDQDVEIESKPDREGQSVIQDAINMFEASRTTFRQNLYRPEEDKHFISSSVSASTSTFTSTSSSPSSSSMTSLDLPIQAYKENKNESRLIQQRPKINEKNITELYLHLIQKAKKEIIISNAYFMPDLHFILALIQASKRHVKIYLLTNSLESIDLGPVVHYTRYLYKYLVDYSYWSKNPFEIYEWAGKKETDEAMAYGTNHTKFMIIDQETLLIGSYNLDPKSIGVNSEVVYTLKRKEDAQKLRDYFFKHDLEYSRKVDYSQIIQWHQHPSLFTAFLLKQRGFFQDRTFGQLMKGRCEFDLMVLTRDIW